MFLGDIKESSTLIDPDGKAYKDYSHRVAEYLEDGFANSKTENQLLKIFEFIDKNYAKEIKEAIRTTVSLNHAREFSKVINAELGM